MAETVTESKHQQPDMVNKLINIIQALDEAEMTKRRGINFSAEYLAEKVAEAKQKYSQLQKFPDSTVKGAILEVMKESAVNGFSI